MAEGTAARRHGWVDLAKGVAIVMVVAYHALLFLETADVGVAPLGRARLALELYPMPAFFLLAGVMQRRLVTTRWAQVWQRRVLPLLYLLVVWSLVRFAFFTALPMVRSDGPPWSGRDASRLLLVLVAPDSIYWFLWALAAVTVLTWLLRRHPVPSVVGAVLVSGAVTSGLVVTGVFAWDRALAFLAPYVVGVHAGPWVVRAVAAMTWRRVALAVGVVLLVLAALVAVPLTRRVPGAALLGQAAVLAAALGAAHLVGERPWTRPLRDLGRRSLPLYLVHLYPVALLTIAVRQVPALHGTPARGMPLVALVTVLSLLASLLVARLLPNRWRLLQLPTTLLRPRRTARVDVAAAPAHVPAARADVPADAPRAPATAGAPAPELQTEDR
ncbi:acyltransferase family protein [Cellulomonas sp. Sa3CUA2]|uniref:Acyltransferase family protein n=1 Tax=Cellulomonas avistercoris TaxID=2762242 RepID=A0ABR8Q9X1_9CELL|nr:acyltransferase family protein [Cellulomonas avistercoris]MBD7917231.1 acyltransferase family protein [Cellulomonas avistercoris]